MTILINQTELQEVEQLPDNIQALMHMIPQGVQCLQVMIANQEQSVSFPSVEAFIEQLNIGLRGTSLLNIAKGNLTVDIKKLLEITTNDLRALSSLEPSAAADQVTDRTVANSQLLEKYYLISNESFGAINPFFKLQSHLELPLMWSANFYDMIVFHDVLKYCERVFQMGQNVKTEAVNWANDKAQTLSELAHYYCFYLALNRHADQPSAPIEAILDKLTPLVLNNLDCPLATIELDQHSLQSAIVQWNEAGNNLGFTSLSSGLQNIALNIEPGNIDSIEEQAIHYIKQLQQQLCNHLATDSFINQAGRYRHYLFALPDKTTMLNIDNIGCLSLYSDTPNRLTNKAATRS